VPVPYQAGSAYVSVVPSLRGFQTKVRTEVRGAFPNGLTIDVTPKFDPGTVRAQAATAARSAGQSVTFKAELDKSSLADSVIGVAALSRALKTLAIPGALVAATPYLVSLAGSAAQASGAIALIPAVAVAAGVAVGTLVVGFQGLGDALGPTGTPAQLKKVEEAMARLAPSARETVSALRAQAPAWDGLRLNVQQQLFEGIAVRVGELANRYLPVLNTQLGLTAARFNYAAQSSANVLMTPQSLFDVSSAMSNVTAATGNAARAAEPLTQAFRDLVVVGSTFLPRMGTGITDLAVRFRDFIAQARESGQLRIWIQQGIDVLQQLWSITGNVASIFRSFFQGAAADGESLLATLDRVTARMANALNTPAGAAGTAQVFATIRDVVGALWDRLVQLWPVVVAAGGAFGALVVAAAPLSSLLFSLVTTALVPMLRAIEFLAPAIVPVVVGFAAYSAAVRGIAIATAAWNTIQLILNGTMRANPIGLVVAALAALVAGLVWAYQNSETFRAIVDAAFRGVAVAGQWLWNTVLKPIFDALAWVVREVLGPVVMWFWTAVIRPAFDGIGMIVSFWWNVIVKPVFDLFVWIIRNVIAPAVMWFWRAVIQPAWDGIGAIISGVYRTVIQPAWNAMQAGLDTLKGWFDRIVDGIGRVWNGLKRLLAEPINFLINTIWNNGMVPAWNRIMGWIPGLPRIEPLRPIGGYREGGPIRGRGTGTSDSNLARVSNDEFIVRAAVARRVPHFLLALNAGQSEALQAAGQVSDRAHFRALQSGRLVEGAGHNGGGYSTVGFGGVRPHVAQAGHFLARMFGIRDVGGVGSRPGPSDHPRGLALDFMTYRDMGKGDRLSDYVVRNAAHLAVKYIIWRQRINEGRGWRGMPNRGSPTANHMDHPHVSFLDRPGAGRDFSGEGGWFNPIPGWIRAAVGALVNPLIDRLPHPPPAFMGVPRGIATMVRDKALDFLLGQAGPEDGGAAAGSGPVVDQVRAAMVPFGWAGGPQWDALYRLVQKESSWNPTAQNPWSTAYGLFQFLNSTWATVGGTKTSNPGLQGTYGARYIRQRYGDPIRALAFHNRNNYYDLGGTLAPGFGTYWNGTGAHERVLDPTNTRSFDTLVGLIASGRLDIGADSADTAGGPLIGQYTQNFYGSGQAGHGFDELEHRMRVARRGGVHSG